MDRRKSLNGVIPVDERINDQATTGKLLPIQRQHPLGVIVPQLSPCDRSEKPGAPQLAQTVSVESGRIRRAGRAC
jgi:hypothetical protein